MSFDADGKKEITSGRNSCAEWSVARAPKKGESICADRYLVSEKQDQILVAVIDGLGHGAKADEASRRAVKTLDDFNNGESIIDMIYRCHRDLRNTRGAVMSLGIINCTDKTLTWIGVGNVEGILLRGNSEKWKKTENIILRGGVVGYELPSLKASLVPLATGDMLIFTTDGVDKDYTSEIDVENKPEKVVNNIAHGYFKETDDALALALEFTKE